jgi:polysaccharide export outer membrane protein
MKSFQLRYLGIILGGFFILAGHSSPGSAQNYAGSKSGATTQALTEEEENEQAYEMTEEQANQLLQEVKTQDAAQAETPADANFAVSAEDESKYTLGPTDVIQISVMRHPEVSGQYTINSEGKIQYEFVGDVLISGLKKNEVVTLLVEKLSSFIINPEVTVKITGYNSKVVYVVGEVGRPGKITMFGDNITVREALIQAGLPLLSGKLTKTTVITPSEDGKPQIRKVNVQKLIYEGDLRENLVMSPGDTLYIPPTFLAKTMRVLQPIAAPIGTAAGTGRTVTTGF